MPLDWGGYRGYFEFGVCACGWWRIRKDEKHNLYGEELLEITKGATGSLLELELSDILS